MERSSRTALAALTSASFALAATSPALAAPLVYEKVAREWVSGVGWIDGQVPAAISASGLVAFAAQNAPGTQENVYVTAGGGPVTPITVSPVGGWDVKAVQVEGSTVAFTAEELAGGIDGPRRRVLTSTTAGAAPVTVHEGHAGAFDPAPVGVRLDSLSLSPNGTLGFSTIRDGQGAIYRRTAGGMLTELRKGTGSFYNTLGGDINDSGQFAVQMEHTDPARHILMRGILLFDTPAQANTDVDTALERLGIGTQPRGAIANDGRVAFAINSAISMDFYDPPFDASGSPVTTITLQPGVYIVTPGPIGEPKSYAQIASTAGAYASFGRVDINASGTVVFEAALDDGNSGIFSGPDATLDKIAKTGEVLEGNFIAWVKLGELNDAGQVAFIADDWYTADYQVFRVSNVTTCAGICALIRAIRRPRPIFPVIR